MAKQQRDPAREQHWRGLVAQWQAIGQSVREFCLQRQLTEANFYAWRRELQQRDTPTSSPSPSPLSSTFVPVTVTANVAAVEVRCPSGHVVTVAHANMDTLRQLFAALAVETPC